MEDVEVPEECLLPNVSGLKVNSKYIMFMCMLLTSVLYTIYIFNILFTLYINCTYHIGAFWLFK